MKKILLTGGGTAGHVMPHMALIPYLKEASYHIDYIGSYKGIEKKLITEIDIPYFGIASGKLRRYFDWKNFTDIFRIMFGTLQATYRIARLKPDVVFSKGGFVTVPVVVGAWLNRVPIVIHESDMTPGLANRIALKFSKYICTTFEKTLRYVPKAKGIHTGSPIRQTILDGNADKGYGFTGLDKDKPVLMMTGGSLGAKALNNALREALPILTQSYSIVHQCGKGNLDTKLNDTAGYKQYEFIGKEMPDLYAMADIVISRAGSNTITEILALKKPNILIPLPASQSRGDQILNANAYDEAGYSVVLTQETLTADSLVKTVTELMDKKNIYVHNMATADNTNGTEKIFHILDDLVK